MPKIRIIKMTRDSDGDYFDQLNVLLDQIYDLAAHNQKWTWGRLAAVSGISFTTVRLLGERQTKYPHLRTVLRLAEAVGLQVRLISAESKKKAKVG